MVGHSAGSSTASASSLPPASIRSTVHASFRRGAWRSPIRQPRRRTR
ncbi:hypothetical protein GGR40_003199 [Novosphingobium gossypii]